MTRPSAVASGVAEEFGRELREAARRHAGRPRAELVELCLLAVEREEIVAVAYREGLMARRLDELPLPADLREVIQQALVWIWRDEEMHAVYVRGALLRLGNPWLKAKTFARQVTGLLGGWAASVRQHTRWRSGPLSRLLASGLMLAGRLSGRVPRAVSQHLRYSSFRDFCRYNVEAERTAWQCWERLVELARRVPGTSPSLIADFRRVQADEDRHGRIFALLGDALDEGDALRPGLEASRVVQGIGEVGEFFLPRRLRHSAARRPLGAGGDVYVERGTPGDDKRRLFRRLLDRAGLADVVRERAAAAGRPAAKLRVAVKAAFMMAYDRRDLAHVTDPELLAELAAALRELGCTDLALIEGPNIYDAFYAGRSVTDVARYLGLDKCGLRVVDAGAEQEPHAYGRGLAQYTVARTWRDADLRLTFPKMRSHPVEHAYLSVPNVEWLGARCDQFLFPERQGHRQTAVLMLLDDFPPHFALLDGYDQAADGLVGVMGCPRAPAPRRLYAARDALALDLVAARHMGVSEPGQEGLLRNACHWFGDPRGATRVVGPDEPIVGWRGPYRNEWSALLSAISLPVYTLGSGRGALFVPEMDPTAFPPLAPEGWGLRLGRAFTRRLLGLRLAR